MIGAGTGVAPYRAFIEERAETGAKGPSWLVFGARNFTTDFLYQLEWQEHLANGALSPSLERAEATVERVGQWMSGLWQPGSQSTSQPTKEASYVAA